MKIERENIIELKNIYNGIKSEIINRLFEFKKIFKYGNEDDIFNELIFCILTPQSKAKLCWDAVRKICEKDVLSKCNKTELKRNLYGVRFYNKKSEYIISAYRQFTVKGKLSIREFFDNFNSSRNARDWLVKNIKGIGYKEASHFLRNIGLGDDLTILDRHILKNLKLLRVINEIPKSISRRKYYEIENKMAEFARQIDIPLSHLDLLLWYSETGEIFK